MTQDTDLGTSTVWVFLVERGVEAGGDIQVFAAGSDAHAAALTYTAEHWPDSDVAIPADRSEAIETYNRLVTDEVITVAPQPVREARPAGSDTRPRCAGCGEPIELASDDDPESWVHAEDANYFGDHTAWMN